MANSNFLSTVVFTAHNSASLYIDSDLVTFDKVQYLRQAVKEIGYTKVIDLLREHDDTGRFYLMVCGWYWWEVRRFKTSHGLNHEIV